MVELHPRAYAAEFIAVLALVFIGGGSIIANELLGAEGFGLLGVAFAHGIVLAVMVTATMHISGGHINPAVTIGQLVARKIDGANALLYIISQLMGGVVGGALLLFAFPSSAWDLNGIKLGTPQLGVITDIPIAIGVEAILTFFLVFTVFATGVDKRGTGQIAGFAIGFVLIFDILVGGPLTGAAMNPARWFGTAVSIGFFDNAVVYWVGPIIGGIVAALVYSTGLLKKE